MLRSAKSLVRLRTLIRGPADAWLGLRMAGWALVLPVLRRVMRMDSLARAMWLEPRKRAHEGDMERVVGLSQLLARRRPPTSNERCLERSLLAYRFLSERGVDPRLVVALKSGSESSRGHAWVTVSGAPMGEAESLVDYVPLVVYGRRGLRED